LSSYVPLSEVFSYGGVVRYGGRARGWVVAVDLVVAATIKAKSRKVVDV